MGMTLGGLSAIETVSAQSTPQFDTIDIDAMFLEPDVARVIEEVGDVAFSRREAETIVLELKSGSTFLSTSVPSDAGKLVYSRYADGGNAEVLFLLDDSPNNPYRRARNQRVKVQGLSRAYDWVQGTNAFITARDGGMRFVRDAHQSELAKLGEVVGKHHSEIDSLVDTADGLYHVFDEDATKQEETNVWVVDLTTKTVQSRATVSTEQDVSIQHHNRDQCLYNFGSCLWSLALPSGCSYCGALCKASKITGWAGYVACFVCLSHICGMTLYSFKGCYDAAVCVDHWNII